MRTGGPTWLRAAAVVARRYQRRRFAWLFLSLLLTLGAHPVLGTLAPGVSLLQILLAANLVVALASTSPERETPWLLGLAVLFAATRGLEGAFGTGVLLVLSQILWVAAGLLVMVVAGRYALGPGMVDGERIFAALDLYLLAGLIFGVGYWSLEQVWPASFALSSGSPFDLSRAIYFSFVTIATLGYGDIVPVSESARGLAILEAVGGQLYIAVLVARLVSIYARPGR